MAITTFKCPHCKRIIDMTDGVHNRIGDIGNPIMQCQYCNGLIKTGAQEWIDFTKSRKLGFWLKLHFVYGLIYGAVFGVLIWGIVVEWLDKSNQLGLILGTFGLLTIFYLMHRAYRNQVINSLKRKPKKQ